MGLLDSNSLNEWAMAIPGRAKAMYQGLLNAPAELKQLFDPKFQKGLLDQRSVTDKLDKDKAMAVAMEATGMAPMGLAGHIVYHSSPHYFTKFDMSKIGTGEGAQAYGHGLYVAESPAVSGIDGEYFNAFKNHPEAIKNGGPFAYKVDIPDEAIPRMLDWDKPLSEQSESVRNALAKSKNKQVRAMLDYAQTPYSADIGGEQKTMGEAFRLLNLNLHGKSAANSAKASALLAKQGIPGIRYLDGMSRGAGQGSSNYVLFDDTLARILEINGQPTGLLPWADDLAKKAKK